MSVMLGLTLLMLGDLGIGPAGPPALPSLIPGFPVTYVQSGTGIPFLSNADLDGDGTYEIVHGQVAGGDWITGELYSDNVFVIDGTGTPWPGFPIQYPPATPFNFPVNSDRLPTVLADLDGDHVPELLGAGQNHLPGVVDVFAYRIDATPVVGWPPPPLENLYDQTSILGIAAGDLDGDGDDEVVLRVYPFNGADMRLAVYDGDGTKLWERSYDFPTYGVTIIPYAAGLAVADLEFDGEGEIVVLTEVTDGWNHIATRAHVLDTAGDPKPGWPRDYYEPLALPRIADVDGDGVCELLAQRWGSFYMFAPDGTPRIIGTTAQISAQTFTVSYGLVTADLNGDGQLEFIWPGEELEIIEALFDVDLLETPTAPYRETWAITSFTDQDYKYDGVGVADVDGDGQLEILAMSRRGPRPEDPYFPNHRYVHIYRQDLQEELPGWPKEVPYEPWGTVPWINAYLPVREPTQVMPMDLDGDGDLEVVYRSGGQIWAWDIPQVKNPVPDPKVEWGNLYANAKWNCWYHEGRVPKFRPGDFNGDDDLDLSDPLGALSYLFLGGDPGDCPASIDVDGDGMETVSDAVMVLNYLFLPGSPVPAAGEPCGTRPPTAGPHPCTRHRCP